MSARPLWVTSINAHKQTDGITNNTFTIYNKIDAEKHYIEKKMVVVDDVATMMMIHYGVSAIM